MSHASSSTGRVTRSSHVIRAIPTASRIRTAPTPLSQTGNTSAVQSGVRCQRTGSASIVLDGDGVGAWTVGTTRAAGLGSGSAARGASCSASNAAGTSRGGQRARFPFGSNRETRGSAGTPPPGAGQEKGREGAGARGQKKGQHG